MKESFPRLISGNDAKGEPARSTQSPPLWKSLNSSLSLTDAAEETMRDNMTFDFTIFLLAYLSKKTP